MWRKEIEGNDDFSAVDQRIRLKCGRDSSHIIKMNIMNTEIYKYLENEFLQYIDNYNKDEKIFYQFGIYKIHLRE